MDYSNTVYRNIFTNTHKEHILNDIGDESDYEVIDAAIQLTSGIDHSKPQFHRPFQYGQVEDEDILAVFKTGNWNQGRFGDGQEYGVWYGAEEELTTIFEACWVVFQLAKDNTMPQGEVYTGDRAMYHAKVVSQKMVDLLHKAEIFNSLVHPVDYSFCQALGKKLVKESVEMVRTPSARKHGGICTPLFSPTPIQKAERVYYVRIHVSPDRSIGVESSRENLNLCLNAENLADPYGGRRHGK